MSAEENKEIYRRWINEVLNKQDSSAIDRYIAQNIIEHAAFPGSPPTIEGSKQALAEFFAGFPDLRITIEDVVAEDDKLAARLTMAGTHEGNFQGVPPTGKMMSVGAMDMLRIEDGMFVEHWISIDQLGMLQQLGLIPPPPGQG